MIFDGYYLIWSYISRELCIITYHITSCWELMTLSCLENSKAVWVNRSPGVSLPAFLSHAILSGRICTRLFCLGRSVLNQTVARLCGVTNDCCILLFIPVSHCGRVAENFDFWQCTDGFSLPRLDSPDRRRKPMSTSYCPLFLFSSDNRYLAYLLSLLPAPTVPYPLVSWPLRWVDISTSQHSLNRHHTPFQYHDY